MSIKAALLTGLISTLFVLPSLSQGTIQLLNGKERRYLNYQIKDEYLLYQPEAKPDSWKKRVDRYSVFSVTPDGGAETVIYSPDTVDGLEPTVSEAREFIAGEKMAMTQYRKPLNWISGVVVGAGSSLAAFYGIPGPVLYSTALGRVSPKLPKDQREVSHSEVFVAGYQKKARTMKINQSLLGGGIGFTVGIAAIVLFLD